MSEQFPMGFWNISPIEQFSEEDVKMWAECGMTVTQSPNFDPKKHDKKLLLDLLDICLRYDIKLILNDSRAALGVFNEEAYRKNMAEAYADFGKHPAVYGFYIGDEPNTPEAFQNCTTAYQIQHETAPNLVPMLNFLPWWKTGIMNHEKHYFEDFISKSGVDFICYDHYRQMNPEEGGTESYFTNLRFFSDHARAAGVPFWTTLLSVGHFRYRCPTQDDFRWQLSTAVASGCKGVFWYLFYDAADQRNYRNSPINDLHRRTAQYEQLAYELRRFKRNHGQLFMDLKLKEVFHINKSYGGYQLFEPYKTHKTIFKVISEHETNGIVSFFTDKENREYIVITNNSKTESDLFNIYFDPRIKTLYNIKQNGKSAQDFSVYHSDAFYEAGDKENMVGVFLSPGMMEVFRLP